MEVIGHVASFFVGFVLGLIGGGGSILSIPILVYLFSIEVVEATAYSLFIVGSTSLVGTFQRFKASLVDFRIGLVFGLPSIISKFCTRKWLIPSVPEVLIQTEAFIVTKRFFMMAVFSSLVILAAATMITKRSNPNPYTKPTRNIWLGIQGTFIGLLTGFSGLGGGFIIVPTLVIFAKLPFKKAVGTTLLVIAMNSLIGFTGDIFHTEIKWAFLMGITAIAIVGIFVGNKLSERIATTRLKNGFGWFILIMGIAILINESMR
jgi:uncharacterized membrane protein YfcA